MTVDSTLFGYGANDEEAPCLFEDDEGNSDAIEEKGRSDRGISVVSCGAPLLRDGCPFPIESLMEPVVVEPPSE